VPEGKYDAAVKDASDAKAALADQQKKLDTQAAQLTQCQGDLAACTGKPPPPPDRSADLAAQLDELRKQKAAADARAALFNEFVAKFRKMIDAGRVSIHVRHGRIVLSLRNDVLFDEGKTDLKPAGKQALADVAQALRTVSRSFQVAGHTDNLPIKNKDFASNWELSTARAVVVVKFLSQQGVNQAALSAAGYSEFDPVAANVDAANRTKNRRIEISLVPNIEELISLPELKGETDKTAP
jgi:chemotaxis protein MotB